MENSNPCIGRKSSAFTVFQSMFHAIFDLLLWNIYAEILGTDTEFSWRSAVEVRTKPVPIRFNLSRSLLLTWGHVDDLYNILLLYTIFSKIWWVQFFWGACFQKGCFQKMSMLVDFWSSLCMSHLGPHIPHCGTSNVLIYGPLEFTEALRGVVTHLCAAW